MDVRRGFFICLDYEVLLLGVLLTCVMDTVCASVLKPQLWLCTLERKIQYFRNNFFECLGIRFALKLIIGVADIPWVPVPIGKVVVILAFIKGPGGGKGNISGYHGGRHFSPTIARDLAAKPTPI
jgi:hypothetical protein